MQTHIICQKYTFCVIKSLEHLKNLPNGPVPCLSLKLTYTSSKAKSISWDRPFNLTGRIGTQARMEMDNGDNNSKFGNFAHHCISSSAAETQIFFKERHTAMHLKLNIKVWKRIFKIVSLYIDNKFFFGMKELNFFFSVTARPRWRGLSCSLRHPTNSHSFRSVAIK